MDLNFSIDRDLVHARRDDHPLPAEAAATTAEYRVVLRVILVVHMLSLQVDLRIHPLDGVFIINLELIRHIRTQCRRREVRFIVHVPQFDIVHVKGAQGHFGARVLAIDVDEDARRPALP